MEILESYDKFIRWTTQIMRDIADWFSFRCGTFLLDMLSVAGALALARRFPVARLLSDHILSHIPVVITSTNSESIDQCDLDVFQVGIQASTITLSSLSNPQDKKALR